MPPLPPTILQVSWELLEADGDLWSRLINYYKGLKDGSNQRIDESRLQFFQDAHPDLVFVGRSSFDGYVVFVFSKSNKAFLENAHFGNALYVMEASEWRELSKLSRTDLIINPRSNVERIIHTGNTWRRRARHLLRV